MKILLIHARSFKYKVVEPAISEPEDIGGKSSGEYNNVIVVFTTVESRDSDEVVDNTVNEILDVFYKVGAKGILIYPYAHLSQDLASPHIALKILKLLEERLKNRVEDGILVDRAPFGWYKEFQLDCYGHPLSELSRTIVSERV
ncbi:MAG: threonyl-tRNA synthetase editing domain-containing protein, partial [Desulfurococcaceae archaeon]